MTGFIDVDGDVQARMFAVPAGGNDVVPAGYQLIERSCIVRLGPQLHIHTAGGHASLGITGVATIKDTSTANEYALRIYTDFDTDRETILSAIALPDYTLVKKRLLPAGGSGGANECTFRIQSEQNMQNTSTGMVYTPGMALPAHGAMFRSDVDNLWIRFLSLRALV